MTPDRETQEKRQHSTTWIPYSYYECRLPEWFMNVPMHWHSEFELIRVKQGRGEFICGSRKWEAGAGELLLVPPNMLHAAYICGEPCADSARGTPGIPLESGDRLLVYDALVFSPVMLGAGSGDRSVHECIRPVLKGNVQMDVCIRKETEAYVTLCALSEEIFSCVHQNSSRADLLLKSDLLRFCGCWKPAGRWFSKRRRTAVKWRRSARP